MLRKSYLFIYFSIKSFKSVEKLAYLQTSQMENSTSGKNTPL